VVFALASDVPDDRRPHDPGQRCPTSAPFPSVTPCRQAPAAAAGGNREVGAPQPLPVVGWQMPEKRPPSWAAPPCARGTPGGDGNSTGLDKAFLMQMASGI
jgi:hypothetical protein